MKILFLSQIVPYPPHGGVLQRGYNVIRELSKFADIHLMAFVHPDTLHKPEDLEDSKKVLSQYCEEIEYFTLWPKTSKFHKYFAFLSSMFYPGPFSVYAHKSAALDKRIKIIMNHGGIDLVHFDTIALARFNHSYIKVPKVVTFHNIESHLMARRARVEKNPLASKFVEIQANRLQKYEKYKSMDFDLNIMMSQVDEDELHQLNPSANTVIVPNGVDVEYFQHIKGKEKPCLIYTGGMNMFANKDAVLYFLAEVWPQVKREVPDVIFYSIGQDPPQELLEMANKDSAIKVMGFVEDVRPYIAESSVYVVPLRVGGGTRLKVVDALAQGKAIVSTSVGCEGITVTDGKNIEIADDANTFSRKVISLLKSPVRREELGNAARELAVSSYSWSIIGKTIKSAYFELVDTSSI